MSFIPIMHECTVFLYNCKCIANNSNAHDYLEPLPNNPVSSHNIKMRWWEHQWCVVLSYDEYGMHEWRSGVKQHCMVCRDKLLHVIVYKQLQPNRQTAKCAQAYCIAKHFLESSNSDDSAVHAQCESSCVQSQSSHIGLGLKRFLHLFRSHVVYVDSCCSTYYQLVTTRTATMVCSWCDPQPSSPS